MGAVDESLKDPSVHVSRVGLPAGPDPPSVSRPRPRSLAGLLRSEGRPVGSHDGWDGARIRTRRKLYWREQCPRPRTRHGIAVLLFSRAGGDQAVAAAPAPRALGLFDSRNPLHVLTWRFARPAHRPLAHRREDQAKVVDRDCFRGTGIAFPQLRASEMVRANRHYYQLRRRRFGHGASRFASPSTIPCSEAATWPRRVKRSIFDMAAIPPPFRTVSGSVR